MFNIGKEFLNLKMTQKFSLKISQACLCQKIFHLFPAKTEIRTYLLQDH